MIVSYIYTEDLKLTRKNLQRLLKKKIYIAIYQRNEILSIKTRYYYIYMIWMYIMVFPDQFSERNLKITSLQTHWKV